MEAVRKAEGAWQSEKSIKLNSSSELSPELMERIIFSLISLPRHHTTAHSLMIPSFTILLPSRHLRPLKILDLVLTRWDAQSNLLYAPIAMMVASHIKGSVLGAS